MVTRRTTPSLFLIHTTTTSIFLPLAPRIVVIWLYFIPYSVSAVLTTLLASKISWRLRISAFFLEILMLVQTIMPYFFQLCIPFLQRKMRTTAVDFSLDFLIDMYVGILRKTLILTSIRQIRLQRHASCLRLCIFLPHLYKSSAR